MRSRRWTPFHVAALAGQALDRCRQPVQHDTCGHRGRTGNPLDGIRRVLRTGVHLLTDKQQTRLAAVFDADADAHVEVEATWGVYQQIVMAYHDPDLVAAAARAAMTSIIDRTSRGVPAALTELVTLSRTLKRRAADILDYFDSIGPVPATAPPTRSTAPRISAGAALGFRNITNYVARPPTRSRGFRPRLHPHFG